MRIVERLQKWDDKLFVINNKRLSLDAVHVVTLWKDISEAKNAIIEARARLATETAAIQKVRDEMAKYVTQRRGHGSDAPWLGKAEGWLAALDEF